MLRNNLAEILLDYRQLTSQKKSDEDLPRNYREPLPKTSSTISLPPIASSKNQNLQKKDPKSRKLGSEISFPIPPFKNKSSQQTSSGNVPKI